jgi:hypothetical protein
MSPTKRITTYFTIVAALLVFVALARGGASAAPSSIAQALEEAMHVLDETDHEAPVDYGAGPGKPRAKRQMATASLPTLAAAPASQSIPSGDASASSAGVFGAPVVWPLIPIHVILLADGRVMSYGTNSKGQQGAQLIYDVWDPSLGTGTDSHQVLPNSTSTDLFCSAQSLLLSGDVLTSGGDLTVGGARNSANNNTTIFSPVDNTLTTNTAMTYARWYGTLLGLPNGQLAIFGGRQNVGSLSPIVPATVPEIYDPGLRTWTSLPGANSTAAFGVSWWYPRAFVAPGGNIFVLGSNGRMFYVATANGGSITQSAVTVPPAGDTLPTVPFAPGKVLSIRTNQQVVVVDFTSSTPMVTPTDPIDQVRFWASGTVLADGRVLVTGGSAVENQLTGVDYQAQIWDPGTGHWMAGASAVKPRLYHSNALLLSDATVLTGGGGAPGPVINLNAEIYYPPYLYATDGTPAVRPVISSTSAQAYDPGSTLFATVGPTDEIARLTLVRSGSATHSNNADQRFIELSFNQSGQTLSATLPGDTSVLVPGSYMLFAINVAGVPSVASFVNITTNAPSFSLSPTAEAFGAVQLGAASSPQAVTLTNNAGTLQLSSINFTGPGAAQFSQTSSCGTSVAAGSTCTINIVFTPSTGGSTSATLNVTAAGLARSATVSGTGSVPFVVSPAIVAFGKVPVNTSPAPQSVTVTNTGSAPLPITRITLTGANASQYSQTNNCPTSVAVGSFCTITVAFMPASTGYLWAMVNVVTPGTTHSSTLRGTGQ